jgi:tyrosyl-tRNA synthetase
MDAKDRSDIICSIGEEVLGKENLINLLTNKKEVIAYDGFEPSGRMHIAQGLLRAHNVNKFIKAGVKFKFWVADWFALMNLKLGGDLNKIQKAGKLMIETWKACGMKLDAIVPGTEGEPMVEFIWSSNEINSRSDEYWKLVLDIGTKFGLNRIRKCTQIMGRKDEDNDEKLMELNSKLEQIQSYLTECLNSGTFSMDDINNKFNEMKLMIELYAKLNQVQTFVCNSLESGTYSMDDINNKFNEMKLAINASGESNKDELAASQIFYPVMQCADVFFLKVDICSLGIDQRKVNVLALEYCDKIKRKNKPVIVSHHMIMGLDGSDKMSKSNPDNTIFMDDSESEVKRKITKAFCEPGNIDKNPILDWIQWLILPITGSITIDGNKKFNEEDKVYMDYMDLENDFKNQKIYPTELKKSLINVINKLLEPVRKHFSENKEASELLNQVKNYTKK